ncbi:MAG TPA: MFS transporter [Acidimicrobiales bacterium]|nr:MFS transporter [Acidimicrobiales bacterium]
MTAAAGSALRSFAGAVARSPKVRAALSFSFRLGPHESDWKHRPFAGLATVNNLSGAGDALVTVALAGSVFVSVSLNAARGRTALGLLCTVLPFAVVGPFLGPAIDRVKGGRRFIVFAAAIGRLAACLMMAAWIHSLLLFPAAFLSLVCSKTHAVAKAALVPGVVDHPDDLVKANSRLAVGGSVITSLAAGVGGLVYQLFGSRAVLNLDVLVFATCAGLSLYLLRNTVEPVPTADAGNGSVAAGSQAVEEPGFRFTAPAPPPPGAPGSPVTYEAPPRPESAPPVDTGAGVPIEGVGGRAAGGAGDDSFRRSAGGPAPGGYPRTGLRPARPGPVRRLVRRLRPDGRPYIPRSLGLASVAMAGMRATAGFLTALVVFAFRHDGAPLIWYGLVAVTSVGGNFGGALLAPRLRFHLSERLLVGGAALLIGGTAIGVTFFSAMQRRPAALILAGVVALGASVAKTAFDAIVQRDTLDIDRSRLFARFESIFQLGWVGGALVPTLVEMSLLVGYILTALLVLGTSAVFVVGLAREGGSWPSDTTGPVSPPPVPINAR